MIFFEILKSWIIFDCFKKLLCVSTVDDQWPSFFLIWQLYVMITYVSDSDYSFISVNLSSVFLFVFWWLLPVCLLVFVQSFSYFGLFVSRMNEWISLVNFFCCCCCCELHLTIIIIIQIINDKLKITKQNLTTCCLTIFCLSPFLFFISMSLSNVNN